MSKQVFISFEPDTDGISWTIVHAPLWDGPLEHYLKNKNCFVYTLDDEGKRVPVSKIIEEN